MTCNFAKGQDLEWTGGQRNGIVWRRRGDWGDVAGGGMSPSRRLQVLASREELSCLSQGSEEGRVCRKCSSWGRHPVGAWKDAVGGDGGDAEGRW